MLVQLRQVTLVPIAPKTPGERAALRERDSLVRRHFIGRPKRLRRGVRPPVEGLQARQHGRPQFLVATPHAVVRAVSGVLRRERSDDVRVVRVIAAPEKHRVFRIVPGDRKEPAHRPRRGIDLKWLAVGERRERAADRHDARNTEFACHDGRMTERPAYLSDDRGGHGVQGRPGHR